MGFSIAKTKGVLRLSSTNRFQMHIFAAPMNPAYFNSFFIQERINEVLSPAISFFEPKEVEPTEDFAPCFILGPARSGSTMLYQHLSNRYRFSYIDNQIHLFHKNFRFGVKRSFNRFGHRPHQSFGSNGGRTHEQGLHAPSECGPFWYNYLANGQRYFEGNELSSQQIHAIRENFYFLSKTFEAPLLVKNLLLAERLKVLVKVFPKAKFIINFRKPEFCVQSMLLMRRLLGIDEEASWSAIPKNYPDFADESLIPRLALQIHGLEKQILQDIPAENQSTIVHYEDLDEQLIVKLAGFITPLPEMRDGADSPKVHAHQEQKVDNSEWKTIMESVEKLDWSHRNG